ncbi:MAG TPA: thioredoxin domain-containing protein [Gaiellaceae bacterium]|jgi:protein-disulfide isomerase|nr:thioredoxin domain-containing protein [Gaiellaceae bacterium]
MASSSKTAKTPGSKPTKTPGRTPTTGGGISRRTLAIALGGAAIIAVLLIAGSLVLGGGDDDGSSGPVTADTALVDGIPQNGTTLGNKDAKVTLIQFEDMQCPACRAYQEGAFPGIVDEYVRPGKINVEFQGLSFIGDDSEQALRAALAAGRQGKFWQMEKLFYDNQGGENEGWVTDELIRDLATQIGLDVQKLEADMDSPAVNAQIAAMEKAAVTRQVQGTPTFFISVDGGTPYQVQPTAFSPEAFRPIFDDALQG